MRDIYAKSSPLTALNISTTFKPVIVLHMYIPVQLKLLLIYSYTLGIVTIHHRIDKAA